MTETKPKRRGFRFSLRTLFVLVTIAGVAAGWVAYQLNWIHQRHEFGKSHNLAIVMWQAGLNVRAPWSLRLFGEPAAVYLLKVPDLYLQEAKALYPEAIINPKPTDFPEERPTAPSLPR
jgi:hypothetical protein